MALTPADLRTAAQNLDTHADALAAAARDARDAHAYARAAHAAADAAGTYAYGAYVAHVAGAADLHAADAANAYAAAARTADAAVARIRPCVAELCALADRWERGEAGHIAAPDAAVRDRWARSGLERVWEARAVRLRGRRGRRPERRSRRRSLPRGVGVRHGSARGRLGPVPLGPLPPDPRPARDPPGRRPPAGGGCCAAGRAGASHPLTLLRSLHRLKGDPFVENGARKWTVPPARHGARPRPRSVACSRCSVSAPARPAPAGYPSTA